jgi:hypothetical protein
MLVPRLSSAKDFRASPTGANTPLMIPFRRA